MMNVKENFKLLQELINARGPCGQEDEVRTICRRELEGVVDEIWIDSADNLIGKISGSDKSTEPIRVMVHMDELSLIVKRINEDGSLRVNPLGGIFPFSFGQGPVEIMGDHEQLLGILSFGSMHTTKESLGVNKSKPEAQQGLGKTPDWDDIMVVTRRSPEALKKAGVHPGTRLVIAQSRRELHFFEDCLAGYFLDNRAALFIALNAFKNIKKNNKKPKHDIYFVGTCNEEIGGFGAAYAARTLPGEITLAIDVGPVAKEYQTTLTPDPIIVYQDSWGIYNKKISDQLVKIGENIGLKPQSTIWSGYGSDASIAMSKGQCGKAALLCFAVENTHGYEITHKDSLNQCEKILENYLMS